MEPVVFYNSCMQQYQTIAKTSNQYNSIADGEFNPECFTLEGRHPTTLEDLRLFPIAWEAESYP